MVSLIPQWTRQIGSTADDDILSLSLESSAFIFVGGYTRGQLPEKQSAGRTDGFLARYSVDGEQLWLKQIGTEKYDQVNAVLADSRRAVYVAGATEGQLDEEVIQGQGDSIILKYSTSGALIWGRQFGTRSSLRGLATDQMGNLWVCGHTSNSIDGGEQQEAGKLEVFVAKFDPQGNRMWIRQLRDAEIAYSESLCVDPLGDVYLAGYSEGDFDREADAVRSDGIIVKFNAAGQQLWSKKIGFEESDTLHAIACTRQGNLYVGGIIIKKTGPEPQDTQDDAFVAKYNAQGEQLWLQQLSTTEFEHIISLDVDNEENVYVGGFTEGQLGADQAQGREDAFLAKYSPEGKQLWLHQFGTSGSDGVQSLAVDYKGAIYAAGYTYGQIGEDSPQGGRDAFLAKYLQATKKEPQEPTPWPIPVVAPINHIPLERPPFARILPVQSQTVLDFLNRAQVPEDLTDIGQYRPDLDAADLASYSIGPEGAQNLLDARGALPAGQFKNLDEVLAVEAIGEDKILDIVDFLWFPTEELFRQELFREVLGENWAVDYWRYTMDQEEFDRLEQTPSLLHDFVSRKMNDIARQRSDNYVIGSLAQALLDTTFPDRVDSLTALTQFASWWFRFDEDNWFSFDRISEVIEPFLNYYNRKRATYIDPVFYRGFQNGGTVADGISPNDLVVTLNPAELAITIWGISLFD